MNKTLTVIGWLAFLCGAVTYLIAWAAMIGGGTVWGIAPAIWFYDSISAVLIGIFLILVVKKSN